MRGGKNPYQVIIRRYITEKAVRLQELETSTSNRCTRLCESPKAVFIVDKDATKPEIASAIEEIYKDRSVKVVKVNTIFVKGKERRVRGHVGMRPSVKKAIVTFEKGDKIEDV